MFVWFFGEGVWYIFQEKAQGNVRLRLSEKTLCHQRALGLISTNSSQSHMKKKIVPIYNYYQNNVPYIQYDKHIIWNTAYSINKSSCKVVLDCYVTSRCEAD